MLDQPGATVTQIAERLGFSDAANFSRAFRRYNGISPTRSAGPGRSGPV